MKPSMQQPDSHRPQEVTELAKERNRQASERTLTSWINQSLWLVGFGVFTAEVTPARFPVIPSPEVVQWLLPASLSLGTIAGGILLLIPITIAHHQALQSLAQADYLTRSSQGWQFLIATVIGVGFWAIVYLILMP